MNQTFMQELRSTNVKINSVHVGGIKTNIVRNARFVEGSFDKANQIREFDKVAGTSPEKAAKLIIRRLVKIVSGN